MDMAIAGVKRRCQPPPATANSGGSVKRRKIGVDFKFSGNNPSSDDELAVSCCSSNTEKEKKLEFADLEHYEDGRAGADTSTAPPHLCGDRSRENDESSIEVGEELKEDMDLLKEEFQIQTDADSLESSPKIESPEITRPTMAEIEDFFAVAEAENLQYFKEKYNFDFAKEEPLEGRFEWRRCDEQQICK